MQINFFDERVYSKRFMGGIFPFSNEDYIIQFQNAFEILFKEEKWDKITQTTLPMFYLLRHYLEISFKRNIEYFQEKSDENKFEKLNLTHNIKYLYDEFLKYLDSSFDKFDLSLELQEQLKTYKENLKNLTSYIIDMDNSGFALRYCFDNKSSNKQPLVDNNIRINLGDLIKNWEGVKTILNFSIFVYEDLIRDLAKP